MKKDWLRVIKSLMVLESQRYERVVRMSKEKNSTDPAEQTSPVTEAIEVVACSIPALWLRRIIREINEGIVKKPTTIFLDIKFAIASTFKSCSKYTDVKYHFLHSCIKSKSIQFEYVDTKNMLADLLTKPFHSEDQYNCAQGIGMENFKKN